MRHLLEAQVSAVLPVFNEVESLPGLMEELDLVLRATGRPYEVILVDDGSADGSGAWIEERAGADPRVRGILLERNVGQSGALAAGLQHARGDIIVTLDADGQNDPSSIPALLAALEQADVVSGVRTPRADSWRRRVSSRVANAVRRAAIGDTISDVGCSLKAYRREALEGIPLFAGAHRFLPALCQFRGARIAEVPVRHRPRRHGVSSYGVGNRLFRGIRDLFGVRWLKARMLRHKIRRMTHE
ncbi:MAG TPA: glycosyltransferase family 2 protein [Candidatus Binatia bacterium]|nr:glycosyltransferase family 2 protein [Candidatus Binatia bacterium]